MNQDNGIQMSRPKTLRRLNLEHVRHPRSNAPMESTTMSPMTDLVHNMSGTSLDSTPKRRFGSGFDCFEEDQSINGLVGPLSSVTSASAADIRETLPFDEKENSYSTATCLASPSKISASDGSFLGKHSPKVRRPALSILDVNSPIKAGFVKPAPPSCGLSNVVGRQPSIEDVDSQDSGCYPEDSKYFKYPERPFNRRSLSDRNSICSTPSTRSTSSTSTGGSQRCSEGVAKLEFSFASIDDEGIPDEIFDEDALHDLPAASSTVSRLFATPLSEKANRQFSSHDDSYDKMLGSPANLILRMPDLCQISDSADKSRPQLRRAWSMYENTTPNVRSSSIADLNSPLDASPVARGLFVQDEDDPGSSPVAPLGLHVARLRMKPYDQRIIQPVGGPASKRSEPPSCDASVQSQDNKRRRDDGDDRSMLTPFSENNVSALNTRASLRTQHRIQRCHSETEATIMRALQRSTEEPDLIGDFTRHFVLPLTRGKHQDLKYISPQTLVDLLDGRFKDIIENFTVVDCRYPYEYNYGHVRNAVNLWTKDMVWNRFMEGRKSLAPPATHTGASDSQIAEKRRSIIVFHCEFSSERGPNLSRYLRNKDRDDNKDNYPALHWPEVYLLEGGYKAFYENFKEWCDPRGYRPMNEPGFEEDLRRCRAKTKSSQGGGKHGRPLTKTTSRRLALN